MCLLLVVLYKTFSLGKSSSKSPNESNKHEHFVLSSDDSTGEQATTAFYILTVYPCAKNRTR